MKLRRAVRNRRSVLAACTCILALGTAACGRVLDAGSDHPRGLLPIDNRNPLVLYNDGPYDNLQGEYAMALASAGQIALVAIIVTSGHDAPSVASNVLGWTRMVAAARASGMTAIPDPTGSDAPSLVRPDGGSIDATQPNGSPGARLIVQLANRLSAPLRPIVVATGGKLTDVADAYLLDNGVGDRVVVVSALGSTLADGGGTMGAPNGTVDPWADEIVARKFRYVQVNTYYDQTADITSLRVMALPTNAFSAWLKAKQPDISDEALPDQIAVMAAALPQFARRVQEVAETAPIPAAGQVPVLRPSDAGHAWVVTSGDDADASATFWQLLSDPATYHP